MNSLDKRKAAPRIDARCGLVGHGASSNSASKLGKGSKPMLDIVRVTQR